MRSTLARRARTWAPEAVAVPVAAGISWQLHASSVPVLLWLTCTIAVYLSITATGDRLVGWSVVHRCHAPGCTFTIRSTGADPGESRRWQEIAAAHPDHRI